MKLSYLLILGFLSFISGCQRHGCSCGSTYTKDAPATIKHTSDTISESPDEDILDIPGAPKFEDHPAKQWNQPSAPLQLKGKERLYRTKLREAYAKGPNFAGYLSIVVIGFGTGSRYSFILDHRTGRALHNPRGLVTSEGMFTSCFWPAYQLNSNLLIISPLYQYIWRIFRSEDKDSAHIATYWNKDCPTTYLVWDGKGFKNLFAIKLGQAILQVK